MIKTTTIYQKLCELKALLKWMVQYVKRKQLQKIYDKKFRVNTRNKLKLNSFATTNLKK